MSDEAREAEVVSDGDERPVPRSGLDVDRWVRRGAWLLVAAAVLALVYLVSAAFFPRWWAQQIGDQVQGRVTAGTLWGLFYGFVFSLIPMLVLFQVRRRFLSWKGRAAVAVLAVVLAIPNWLTLSIVVGQSRAAHAGERILDVEGPGFRTATLIGVLVGIALSVAITGLFVMLHRRKLEVRRLKADLDSRDP